MRKWVALIMAAVMVLGFLPVLQPAKVAAAEIVTNGSFESDLIGWTTNESAATSIQTGWSPSEGGTKRLNYWSQEAYTADTFQTVTDLSNGTYTLSAWMANGGGFNTLKMYVKDTGAAPVELSIPAGNAWTQISLPVTVENGQMTIGFYADAPADSSGKWIGVDLVSLRLEEASAPQAEISNGSFENDLTGWTVEGPVAIGTSNWFPTGGGTKRADFYQAAAYTADLSQTVTGLEDGKYLLSAWYDGDDGFTSNYIYAKVPGQQDMTKEIPDSSGWTEIKLPVQVTGGQVTVGFHTVAPAGKWFAIDLVELAKVTETGPVPVGINIPNRSFTNEGSPSMDGWSSAGDTDAAYLADSGYLDSGALSHYKASPYQVSTSQTLTDLENGYYTLTAWTQNGGGQKAAYLFSKDNGTSESRASLPVSNEWTKVVVRGIHVTNGTITIGLFSDALAGQWAKMDWVELVKDDQPYRLLKGGDVSELSYVESKGGSFYDRNGNPKDLFQILKENGHDIVRIRLYNDPGKGHGDGTYYRPAGIMDKEDVLKLSRRAKAAGLQIQLSFHYSDYWTNGAIQNVPHEWKEQIEGLTDNAAKVAKLEQLLRDYTREIMEAMASQGTTPEYVSLGNEMQSGLLYPYGGANQTNWGNLALFLKAGSEAVKSVSPSTRIILHLDDAGNYDKYYSFFDKAEELNVPYDIIGPSYYPFWTDKSVEQIVEFCNAVSQKYDKDIMIMETGYNWNPTLPNGNPGQLSDNGPYPSDTSSPEGQRNFMLELFNGLKSVDNGRVIGDLYWDPIMIGVPGVGWAYKEIDDQPDVNVVSNTTLFDFMGKALPAHDAYRYNTEGSTVGQVTGVVRGTGGRGIAKAAVNMTVNGTVYEAEADLYGNYLFPDVEGGSEYTVTAAKQGYQAGASAPGTVVAGQLGSGNDVVLTGGSIEGTVRDDAGLAMAGVTVRTESEGVVYSAVTDAEGHYSLHDLPQGDGYSLTASKTGYADGTLGNKSVSIGETTSGADLTVTLNSGTIEGTVRDKAGDPLDGAQVQVTADGSVYTAVTDASGAYRIVNVPAGSGYTVTAVRSGYVTGSRTGISVAVGQTTGSVHFALDLNLGNISGKVSGSDGLAVPGAAVTATGSGMTYTAVTDANGNYSITEVLAGVTYKVTAHKDGFLDGVKTGVSVAALQTTAQVNLRVATEVPVENNSFETQGTDKYSIPDWTIAGTEHGTYSQKHSAAKSGEYALSGWMEGPFTSDVSQTITGLQNGMYTLEAWFYNGGGMNAYYMYAGNSGSDEVRQPIPAFGSMTQLSLNAEVKNGQLTIGFHADANAGNWMIVDDVRLGYQGPVQQQGGSGGGNPDHSGSTGGSGVQAPTSEVRVVKGTVEVQPAVTADGVVDVTIPAETLAQAIQNADDRLVGISVNAGAEAAEVRLSLPAQLLNQTSDSGIEAVRIDTGMAVITMNPELIAGQQSTGSSIFSLSVAKVDSDGLPQETKDTLGGRQVYDFNMTLDGSRIGTWSPGDVTVSLPYELQPGENPHQVVVYYVDDSGKLVTVRNGRYDPASGKVEFKPKHFSRYAAAYAPVAFRDLEGLPWAQEGIMALAARGIVDGVGQDGFQPDSSVTRAEFITMLMRGMDSQEQVSGDVPFEDVQAGAWYAGAVSQAFRLGIVQGVADDRFGINEPITRQDMAVMIRNVAHAMGVKLASSQGAVFTDRDQLASYAADAVAAAAASGIVNGYEDGGFAPLKQSTRAEAAVMLYRLFQLIDE